MILYDWRKVYIEAGKSPTKLVNLIAYLTFPRIPDNSFDTVYKWSQKDWSGASFIVNPENILTRRENFKDIELAEYVALASFRSYAAYLATGIKYLPMELSPIDSDFINNNRLLTLSDDNIYFAWEEVNH